MEKKNPEKGLHTGEKRVLPHPELHRRHQDEWDRRMTERLQPEQESHWTSPEPPERQGKEQPGTIGNFHPLEESVSMGETTTQGSTGDGTVISVYYEKVNYPFHTYL